MGHPFVRCSFRFRLNNYSNFEISSTFIIESWDLPDLENESTREAVTLFLQSVSSSANKTAKGSLPTARSAHNTA